MHMKKVARIKDGFLQTSFEYEVSIARAFSLKQQKGLWKFCTKTKMWLIPKEAKNAKTLKRLGFKLSPKAQKLLTTKKKKVSKSSKCIGLKYPLYPYQQEGMNFVEECNGRAIIGDDMGIGKTLQALAYLHKNKDIRPAVVVCPASVKLGWADEIHKFKVDIVPVILNGRKPSKRTRIKR